MSIMVIAFHGNAASLITITLFKFFSVPTCKRIKFCICFVQNVQSPYKEQEKLQNPRATDDYSQGKTQIKTQHAAILMKELLYWFHDIKCLLLLTTPYLLVPLITIHLLSESMQYTTESWGSSHFKTQDATLKRVHCMIRNYLKWADWGRRGSEFTHRCCFVGLLQIKRKCCSRECSLAIIIIIIIIIVIIFIIIIIIRLFQLGCSLSQQSYSIHFF